MTAIQREKQAAGHIDTSGTDQAAAKGAGAPTRSARRASLRVARAPRRPKSEAELLEEISAKLDRLVAVVACQGKDRDTQVAILAAASCDSAFIATLVGMTPGAVRKLSGWRRAQEELAPDAPEEPA